LLSNIHPAEELRSLAIRNAKSDEFKTVRNPLVPEEVALGWEPQKIGKVSTRLRRPKSHDRLFEDRVWTILYHMGFKHLSGKGGAHLLVAQAEPEGPDNQIDVVAIDDEVAFAIECKSSERPRRFADFSATLAKHVDMRDRFTRAIREQLPVEGKRTSLFAIWRSGIAASDNDRVRAESQKVALLDERDLNYYEQLVDQIGVAARFQFLADLLEGRTVPGLEVTVPAIKSRIGRATAYTFSVSPEYLLKIAFVSHRARGKPSDIDAYQRLLKKSRLRAIREYITEGGFFPTNIVVNIADPRWLNFDRGKQASDGGSTIFGWLHIRPAYRVAWIIDGQHRLFAYADHPRARKSLISVIAFVGLEPSEQARLFVDINAQQKKVKQSLLQELYAELHWDAADPETRVQAILSKVIQAIDGEPRSPFEGRILKADDVRTEQRCISLTAVFKAMEQGSFFIGRTRKGAVLEYGPLWRGQNSTTLKRATNLIIGYFEIIKAAAPDLWQKGAADGGGLSMNDGVTVCINALKSIFHHLQTVKRVNFADLDDNELVEAITPLARKVGQYFAGLSATQMSQFRALRGVQGQTTGTKRLEQALRATEPTFNPPGLEDFIEREKAQTTGKAFAEIQGIEQILQATILDELKSEFGSDESQWWFSAIPKSVRKKVDDRINEEGGKKGGRQENFDLVDYREIVTANWTLFENLLAKGKGNKEAKTKWIVEVNELRKPVMHASKGQSLPISEEQLAQLQEVHRWLETQVGNQATEQLENA
jgi:DGQHR domain-containing protein